MKYLLVCLKLSQNTYKHQSSRSNYPKSYILHHAGCCHYPISKATTCIAISMKYMSIIAQTRVSIYTTVNILSFLVDEVKPHKLRLKNHAHVSWYFMLCTYSTNLAHLRLCNFRRSWAIMQLPFGQTVLSLSWESLSGKTASLYWDGLLTSWIYAELLWWRKQNIAKTIIPMLIGFTK